MGGILNTAGRGPENTVHLIWRNLRRQAAKSYMSQRTMRPKNKPYKSQETAPTVFETPLTDVVYRALHPVVHRVYILDPKAQKTDLSKTNMSTFIDVAPYRGPSIYN